MFFRFVFSNTSKRNTVYFGASQCKTNKVKFSEGFLFMRLAFTVSFVFFFSLARAAVYFASSLERITNIINQNVATLHTQSVAIHLSRFYCTPSCLCFTFVIFCLLMLFLDILLFYCS